MKNTIQTDMLEIIFAGRNKAYGAYQIRRAYPDYLIRAFFAGITVILLFSLVPRILKSVAASVTVNGLDSDTTGFTKVLVERTPPPPKVQITPPPMPKAAIRFVPPKVVIDHDVPEDQNPTTLDVLDHDVPIGIHTVDGENGSPIIDDPGIVDDNSEGSGRAASIDTVMNAITVEKMPSFPGGDAEMMKFIRDNVNYPAIARESNIQGTVAISFVVGKDGAITDMKILKDIGGLCGKEAVRVVGSMPRWIPGEANGHPVRVRYTLPVRFRLE